MRALCLPALVTAACGAMQPVASSGSPATNTSGNTLTSAPSNTATSAAGDRTMGMGTPSRVDALATPYQVKDWIEKLADPSASELAVAQLELLGDSSAIPVLGATWGDRGKPARMLQVIISLARPLTPDEAKARFLPKYEAAGRPASWDQALPFLIRALAEVDEANSGSVDDAAKAAKALGEAKLPGGLDALIELANKPATKKLIVAEIAAISALGKPAGDKRKAVAALLQIVEREPPPYPRKATDQEKYSLFLDSTRTAINALGELRTRSAARPLVLALYRTPELLTEIGPALVATGPSAEQELIKTLRGENAAVNRLSKQHFEVCSGQPEQCKMFVQDCYAPLVLGDFYDSSTVPDLLAELKRPALPNVYFFEQLDVNTRHGVLLDALLKIGGSAGAEPVRAMWMNDRAREPTIDLDTKIHAIRAYPFLTRDTTGTEELGRIAADNKADDQLRMEAATAFALLSRNPKDIDLLRQLAQRYLNASAAKVQQAAQQDAAADDQALETLKQALDSAKANLQQITNDGAKTPQEIEAARQVVRQRKDAFQHMKTLTYKGLLDAARAYTGYARMFQRHIARIEIALRCKTDLACYAASLALTPDEAAANNAKYIQDIQEFTADEKHDLVAAAIERAILELGKAGAAAGRFTEQLLDAAVSDDRVIRRSILLALPKIAPRPCAICEAKLEAALRATEGKPSFEDLNRQTTMLRNYFAWAGRPLVPPAPE